MNSNHSPVLLTLSYSVINKENSSELANKGTYGTSFKLQLERNTYLPLGSLKTPEELDIPNIITTAKQIRD